MTVNVLSINTKIVRKYSQHYYYFTKWHCGHGYEYVWEEIGLISDSPMNVHFGAIVQRVSGTKFPMGPRG